MYTHENRKGEGGEIKNTQKSIIQLKYLALFSFKRGTGTGTVAQLLKCLLHIHWDWSLIPRRYVKRLGLAGHPAAPEVDL